MKHITLFCGFDKRETVGFYVFLSSVFDRASVPIVIRRMDSLGLRVGSNAFTFSRFLVPFLSGFKGRAIFADASDMLMLADVAQLDRLFDDGVAVQVVKHAYRTRHRRKYVGTAMECDNRDYARKNWASLMLINCEHPAWAGMTPERVERLSASPLELLGFNWCAPADVGDLPDTWNRLADEGQMIDGAKLIHWTAGIPAFAAYADAPGADLWRAQRAMMLEAA